MSSRYEGGGGGAFRNHVHRSYVPITKVWCVGKVEKEEEERVRDQNESFNQYGCTTYK